MLHSRFRHIRLRMLPVLLSFFGFTSCLLHFGEDCCGCDCEDEPSRWYTAIVDARYDTEWFLLITPRLSWQDDTAAYGVEFSKLRPQIPEGLRIISYPDEGGEYRSFNLPAHGGDINLHALSSHLLFYNNDTEYIIIDPKAGFDATIATTRRQNGGNYKGNPKVGTVDNPQPIYSQPDMLFRTSLSDYNADGPDSLRVINVTLQPAVFSYVVHFQFTSGLEYVSSARGAITGMASGVNLSTGDLVDDTVTLLYDCEKEDDGMTGVVKSFGLPGYTHEGEPIAPDRRYGITLQTYLTNGKLLTFDFDVTPQMMLQPYGGVVMVAGIEITDTDGKPSGGNGAFDVDVDPWGPSEDIDIM